MTTFQEQLNSAKKTVVLTAKPLPMEKVGDTFRGMYLGSKTESRVDEHGAITEKVIYHFFDGERVYFSMGAQLGRVIHALPVGISVEITFTELSPNKKSAGKTKIYDVAPLDVPVMDVREMFGGILVIQAETEAQRLDAPKDEEQKPEDNRPTEEKINELYSI